MFIANREWWEPPSSGMVLGSSASLPSCQFPDIFKLLVDLASLGCVEWCVRAAAAWICQLVTSTCVRAPDKQIACTRQADCLQWTSTETAHTQTPIPPLQKQKVHKTLHNWVFGREHGKIAHLTFWISMYKYLIKNVITQLRWFKMLTHQSDNLISMAEPIAWWIVLMARGQMSRHNSPQPRLRMSKNKR